MADADDETQALLANCHSGPPSRDTPSPPTEEISRAAAGGAGSSSSFDEEEGEEEELPEWAAPEFIAENAPSKRTRGGIARTEAEARGSALRTRRAVGAPAGRSSARGASSASAAAPPGAVKKVIVVGAGYAGITAARTLIDFGYQVQVIEGRARIGGRVHSASHKLNDEDVTVELGAAVLMGDVRGGNPLARLCAKYGVAVHTLNNSCPLHDVANGGALLPADADQQAEKLFNDLLEAAHEERTGVSQQSTGLDASVAVGTQIKVEWSGAWYDAKVVAIEARRVQVHYERWSKKFDEWLPLTSNRLLDMPISQQALEQVLTRQLARLNTPLDKSAQRALHWHLANLEFACAAPLTTVSAQDWDQDDANEYAPSYFPWSAFPISPPLVPRGRYDGDHMILPQGGYGALLGHLAEGIDVKLRCTVRAIHHGVDGVRLDTSSGVMKADAVVCTLPLGVLQLDPEKGGVLFSPPLPPPKQAAISRLGFGVLNKVALFFDTPFWEHSTDFFGRVVPNPKHRGRFFLFFNLHPASGSPVLLALAAGAAAAELEELDDDAVTAQSIEALQSMFGARKVPQPVKTVVTRWGADKFARGSYSYVHVGASGHDYATIGEPVGERLFFAGEHTIMEHPATVVGAYLSGLRAGRALHGKQKAKASKAKGPADARASETGAHEAEYYSQHARRAEAKPQAASTHRAPPAARQAAPAPAAPPAPAAAKRPAPPAKAAAGSKRARRGGDSSLKLRRMRDGLGVLARAELRRAEMNDE